MNTIEDKKGKLITIFFEDFMNPHGVRELAKKTKLSTASVQKFLKELVKEKLIVKIKKKGKYAKYKSNYESRLFRHKKSSFFIEKILKSGLVEYLEKETRAKSIVLFGSIAKGTYHENSDIDIFLQREILPIYRGKFEDILGKEINFVFCSDLTKLSDGFMNNLARGLVLSGDFDVTEYASQKNNKGM